MTVNTGRQFAIAIHPARRTQRTGGQDVPLYWREYLRSWSRDSCTVCILLYMYMYIFICMCVCVCVCVCIYTYTHIHTYVYIYIYVCIYVSTYVGIHRCVRVFVLMYACACVCVCVCVYVYINTYFVLYHMYIKHVYMHVGLYQYMWMREKTVRRHWYILKRTTHGVRFATHTHTNTNTHAHIHKHSAGKTARCALTFTATRGVFTLNTKGRDFDLALPLGDGIDDNPLHLVCVWKKSHLRIPSSIV